MLAGQVWSQLTEFLLPRYPPGLLCFTEQSWQHWEHLCAPAFHPLLNLEGLAGEKGKSQEYWDNGGFQLLSSRDFPGLGLKRPRRCNPLAALSHPGLDASSCGLTACPRKPAQA